MKLSKLVSKAKEEIKTDMEKAAIVVVKGSLKNISDCKKTLTKLEDKHKELLNMNIEDLELDDFEY